MNIHFRYIPRTRGKFALPTEAAPAKLIKAIRKSELPDYYAAGWRVLDFSGDQVRIEYPQEARP